MALKKPPNQKTNSSIGTWNFTKELKDAFKNSDAIIILTEWEEYLDINWNEVSLLMRKPSWLFDTRGIVDTRNIKETNLNFWKVGRGFNA